MRLHRYRPAFFSGYDDESVGDWDGDPMSVPWVARWATDEPKFYRFSLDANGPSQTYVMAELDEGREWYVTSWFDPREGSPGLPEWDHEAAVVHVRVKKSET